ncbi:DUF4442 domain-containing protein [Halovibrio salipaludis]|uniref:DUF4442 domain-containing protein n=1 Tax=Halovibrio salipaludis TaxID=2032626 RepID=A0A2A2F8P7_9GAMM|nr:DUF4442 domain-containing protein [Halovibrio salipaludis]PAU81190.1 DUF4442 domain-containing protein [Halovibrio salipaludis]
MKVFNTVAPRVRGYFGQLEASGRPIPGLARFEKKLGYGLLNRLIAASVPFTSRNGFRVVELREGYLRARLTRKGNRNHLGTVYAGAQFLLAEIPFGAMALVEFGGRLIPVLKDLHIFYDQPARTDLEVELTLDAERKARIEQDVADNGKAELIIELDLKDASGEIVARAEANYQVRPV